MINEFNKDKLKVEDTHTEITLKDGKLCISVFIPQLNVELYLLLDLLVYYLSAGIIGDKLKQIGRSL